MLTEMRYSLIRLRWQILGWGLGIASLGLIIVGFYDTFMEQQEDFLRMVESYPPEFLAFFGGDVATLATPEGFLGMYGFSMLPVMLGAYASSPVDPSIDLRSSSVRSLTRIAGSIPVFSRAGWPR